MTKKRKAPEIPKEVPSLKDSDLRDLRSIRDLKPKTKEVKEAFRDSVVEYPDGTYEVKVRGRKNVQLLHEMNRPYMRALSARSLNRQLSQEKVAMKGPNGATYYVEPARAETFAITKGYVAVKRHRGRPAHEVPKSEFRTPWPWENVH